MTQEDRIIATKTAFEILDVVHESRGASVTDLTEAIDLSRAGVYKHLRTLIDVGALTNRNGVYILGPKFTEYALDTTNSHIVLDQTNKVDRLAQSLDAPTNLWVYNTNICHCVYTTLVDGREKYPRSRNDTERLVESPPGKVMLANLPSEQRTAIVETLNKELSTQLETLWGRQLLEEPLSFAPEWVSIATPVLDPSDEPIASIEIVIPSKRADGIDVKNNIQGLLRETANKMRVEML